MLRSKYILDIIYSKFDIEILFCDRTFSTLEMATEHSLCKLAVPFLNIITRWKQDTAPDFISATCYKVLANDVNDKLVTDLASLKNGISTKLVYISYIYIYI